MRKISLVRLLFRPVSTIKQIWQVCQAIDIEFKVKAQDKAKDVALPHDGYVTIDCYHALVPVSVYKTFKDSALRLDYSYHNSNKVWAIKDGVIPVTVFTKDEVTALHVAKRLGV